jgi:L-ascorbate metabolism protein UlaG (beta-lactamase superfamily)
MKKSDILNLDLTDRQTGLWYLGQEGFVVSNRKKMIAIDPYLSDYVDQNCCQYVEWKRLYPAPIAAEELDFLEAVLCTHTHYDHADPWTLGKIASANEKTKFIVPAPEVDTVAAYGIDKSRILPAYADQPIHLDGFTITPIPSAHEVFHTDEAGNYRELGYMIDDGSTRIFHAGDMCMYDGLVQRLCNIDVSILPINGRDYFRNANDIIGNFDAVEAVTLAKIIQTDLLIPVHHDLYDVNKVDPAYFVNTLMTINREQKYHIFVPGEKYIYM